MSDIDILEHSPPPPAKRQAKEEAGECPSGSSSSSSSLFPFNADITRLIMKLLPSPTWHRLVMFSKQHGQFLRNLKESLWISHRHPGYFRGESFVWVKQCSVLAFIGPSRGASLYNIMSITKLTLGGVLWNFYDTTRLEQYADLKAAFWLLRATSGHLKVLKTSAKFLHFYTQTENLREDAKVGTDRYALSFPKLEQLEYHTYRQDGNFFLSINAQHRVLSLHTPNLIRLRTSSHQGSLSPGNWRTLRELELTDNAAVSSVLHSPICPPSSAKWTSLKICEGTPDSRLHHNMHLYPKQTSPIRFVTRLTLKGTNINEDTFSMLKKFKLLEYVKLSAVLAVNPLFDVVQSDPRDDNSPFLWCFDKDDKLFHFIAFEHPTCRDFNIQLRADAIFRCIMFVDTKVDNLTTLEYRNCNLRMAFKAPVYFSSLTKLTLHNVLTIYSGNHLGDIQPKHVLARNAGESIFPLLRQFTCLSDVNAALARQQIRTTLDFAQPGMWPKTNTSGLIGHLLTAPFIELIKTNNYLIIYGIHKFIEGFQGYYLCDDQSNEQDKKAIAETVEKGGHVLRVADKFYICPFGGYNDVEDLDEIVFQSTLRALTRNYRIGSIKEQIGVHLPRLLHSCRFKYHICTSDQDYYETEEIAAELKSWGIFHGHASRIGIERIPCPSDTCLPPEFMVPPPTALPSWK